MSNNGKLVESFNKEFTNSNNLAFLIEDNFSSSHNPSSSIKILEKKMKY
jgi:hypothetical protein